MQNVSKLAKAPIRREKLHAIRCDMSRDWMLYLMLLLPIVFYTVFCYGPMYGVVLAFKDYNIMQGISGSKWVGLKIFRQIFALSQFSLALRNTLVLNVLDLVFGFPAPIILAILLNEVRVSWFKRFTQTVVYLPYFLSWIVVSGMIYQLFSTNTGIINNFLMDAFKVKEPIPFLTDKALWIMIYVVSGIWKSAGFGTIIFLAAISAINPELYEAAEADGASRLQKIWHITLPGIKSTIVILLILNIGSMMTIGFDRPLVVGNNSVLEVSSVISVFTYRIGLEAGRFNTATAVGLFQSVVGMIFLVSANAIAGRLGEEGIW